MLEELIGDVLETVLFKQLVEHEFGEGVEIPKVKWRPIWEPTIQEKAKFIGDLVEKGIIMPSEARMQLGFPEEYPEAEGKGPIPQMLPKPKSESSKIVEKTVRGVVEQLKQE
jgi:hypothetical protein